MKTILIIGFVCTLLYIFVRAIVDAIREFDEDVGL